MSNQPAKDGNIHCGDCGAVNLARHASCWLCGAPRERFVFPKSARLSRPATPAASSYRFALSSLFLLITLIAICLGLFLNWPGLGAIVTLIAFPAFLRTIAAERRLEQQGNRRSKLEKTATFVASLAIVSLIVAGAFSGFCMTCGSIGFVSFLGFNSFQEFFKSGLTLPFVVGIIVGSILGIALLMKFWKQL